MKNTVFTGAATAVITPMNETGVDYDAFGRLIDFQLSEGIDGIVVAGTTGEASTLTEEEYTGAVSFCVKRVGGRVPVIAGSGANDTAKAIEKTKLACSLGADAVLLVTPYYNKTTQRGLVAHYTAIADASDKPCILYNVPSRTGLNMTPDTLNILADHPRIAAVKEACGDICQPTRAMALCGDRLDIYSGDDAKLVPMLSIGARGVISVVSNIMPRATAEICRLWFDGKVKESNELFLKLLPLMDMTMIETNPIPAKAACAAMGFGKNIVRLPLVPMEEKNEKKMLDMMKELGVL